MALTTTGRSRQGRVATSSHITKRRRVDEAPRQPDGRPRRATIDGHSLRTLADLASGDHLCCLYETEEEHRAVLTPFMRRGLERGEKLLYIVDARSAETVLGYLRDEGLRPEPYMDRGQLAVLTAQDAYMREGVFDPDGMIAMLRTETERALAEGYTALRVTGEMSWALRGLPGSERLIEYESKLNQFFPGSDCLAICQYDCRFFAPSLLLDVLSTHPITVVGTEVYDNFYYMPSNEFLGHEPLAARLRHWVANLARRKRAEERLNSRSQELLTLHKISKITVKAQSLEATYQDIIEEISSATGFPIVAIELYDQARQKMMFRGVKGVPLPLGGGSLEVPVEETLSGIVARTGRPLVETNAWERPEYANQTLRRLGVQTFICVPMTVGRRVVGVLSLGHPERVELGDGLLQWLESLASYVASMTERKRAEEALRESEEKARAITDAAADAIISVDSEGRVLHWNPASVRLFGYTSKEAIGKQLHRLIVPDEYRDACQKGLRKFRATGQGAAIGKTLELSAIRRDGTEFPVELSLSAVRIRGEWNAIGIVRDITDRKRAEEALRESETRLWQTLDDMLEGCQIIGSDWRYLYVNNAVCQHGRRAKEELLGHTMMEMYPGIENTEMFGHLRRCMQERTPHRMEDEFTYPDGDKGWFELSIQPVPEGIFVLSLDITERKRAEEALQQAREELEDRVERQMQRSDAYGLTFRELTVLHLVAAGKADKEIALHLGISPLTAQKHVANILDKMGAASRTEACVRALREGLLV